MNAPLRAKQRTNKMIVYGILGLLALSLTGFGVRSIGQGGTQAIAEVGGQKVTVDQYASAVRSQLAALSRRVGRTVTMEQARSFGLDRQVLQQVVASAALDDEDARLGISIGDQRVRDALLKNQAFQDLTGKFDDTTYKEALRRANMKPAQYDSILRRESARTILQSGVVGGIKPNDTYALALLEYVGETRSFDWAEITPAMLPTPTRAPTEAEITAQYKSDPATYTSPELRKITYVKLTPDMMMPSIKVDEKALRDLYNSLSDTYHIPARRIVDRLVFPTEKAAQAAIDSITSGAKLFDDVVINRGLAVKDVSMGEITGADLSDPAEKAVFGLVKPGVVGPVQSALGPAIFRVNAILAPKDTSFEQARKELEKTLLGDTARRQVDDKIASIDDLLAGGATLEDVANETAMTLAKLDYVKGDKTGFAANAAFRKAVEKAKPGDFAEVVQLANGGIFAMRLDKIVPPALIPLAKVRDRVIADWTRAETRKRVIALADQDKAAIKGGKTFTDLGLGAKSETGVERQIFVDGAPRSLVREVFKLAKDGLVVATGKDKVVLARLTAIQPFDPKKPQSVTVIKSLKAQYALQVGNDIFDAFARAVEDKAGVTINQALVNAVQAQIN